MMAAKKFTLEPWRIGLGARAASLPVEATGSLGRQSIASVWCRVAGNLRVTAESQAEGRANALLIAAAPELYTALADAFEGDADEAAAVAKALACLRTVRDRIDPLIREIEAA